MVRKVLKASHTQHAQSPTISAVIFILTVPFQSRFGHSPTNGSHSLSLPKAVHTCLRQQDRTQRLTRRNTGRFGWGRYHYPWTVLRGSETLRGRVSERHTLPLLSLGRGALSKNAESLRDSDALMCVAVSRRRGPAGLLRCCIPRRIDHLRGLSPPAPMCRERITVCLTRRAVSPALPAPCFAQQIRLTRRAADHRIAP